MDLAGRWRAHPADDDLRRLYHDESTGDDDWFDVTVPSPWAAEPGLDGTEGPVLYRRRFTAERPGPRERAFLWLDGVFSEGDVWFDGGYLGATEGTFFAHSFEVTAELAARPEHLLALEVGCPTPGDLDHKRSITGGFHHGDHLRPGTNPGGLWGPVRIVRTGPVAIRHGRLVCRETTEQRAVLALRLVVHTEAARPVVLRTRVAGVEVCEARPLAAGENRIEWQVVVPRPARWWPRALGPQPLHDVAVDVLLDDGSTSDRRRWRTGLRSIELRNWIAHVNGERLYLKGAAIAPPDPAQGPSTAAAVRSLLGRAVEAHLDLVRVHTHIASPALYDLADELGILLWQDFPLHGRYARSVRTEAVRQAREAVDLLGHHPCVALWNAHDEPDTLDGDGSAAATGAGRRPVARLVEQQRPSWNRSILDRSVKRAFERHDGSRPVLAHSGVLPHLPQLDGTSAHLWFGWYGGSVDDLRQFAATLPRHLRFVAGFGAQAPPVALPLDLRGWPPRDAGDLPKRTGMQTTVVERLAPWTGHATEAGWRRALHDHQALVVKHTVEFLRRIRYRPTGGFCLYRLDDTWPSVGFGVIDAAGRPKPGFGALAAACRPLLPVADPLPPRLIPGETRSVTVHVVNDGRTAHPDARIEATVHSSGGISRWAWSGDVAADACLRVGDLEWDVPPDAGPVTLELRLTAGDLVVTNSYGSEIL
jgi:beta-mannosidase